MGTWDWFDRHTHTHTDENNDRVATHQVWCGVYGFNCTFVTIEFELADSKKKKIAVSATGNPIISFRFIEEYRLALSCSPSQVYKCLV